jgi:hypothetical protein
MALSQTSLPVPREIVTSLVCEYYEDAVKAVLQALSNDACAALLTLIDLGIERIASPDDSLSMDDIFERFAGCRSRCESEPRLARHFPLEKALHLTDYLTRGLQVIDGAGVQLVPLNEYWGAIPRNRDSPYCAQSAFTYNTYVAPTAEQQAILDAVATASAITVLKTIALAGTGKTTLCEFIGEAHVGTRMIYLAFNRIMDEHARNRLGHLMTCRTIDGLAYSVVQPSRIWGEARTRPGARCDWAELGDALGLPPTFGGFRRRTVAQLLHQTVMNYCYSADIEINASHIAKADWPAGSEDILQRWATDLWYRMLSTNEYVPVPPPQVMKYWQLRDGVIPYDLVLFDECQDANPAFMNIVSRSACRRKLIGDPHQQLFEWRGAVDSM